MRYIAGLLILTSAFVGCGGGDGEDVDTPTPASLTASASPNIPTATVSPQRARVGQVGVPDSSRGGKSVVGDVELDGEPALEEKLIFKESRLATGDNSSVEFTLDDGPIRCDTGENSLLDIFPRVVDSSEQVVIRWDPRDSSSFCNKSGPAMQFGIGDRIKLVMGDPIFGVVISDGSVRVKLVEGDAKVTVNGTVEFALSQGEELFVPPDDAGGIQNLELTKEELAIVDRLRGDRPNLTAAWNRYSTGIDFETCEIWYGNNEAAQPPANP
jgi:hypothetical protein